MHKERERIVIGEQNCNLSLQEDAQIVQMLWNITERLWSLLLGDIKKSAGHGPEQPAVGVPAGAGVGTHELRGPCQQQPCSESV